MGTVLGRVVHDADGNRLGRVADLVTGRDAEGRERVVAVVVTPGRWGRLLGYERADVRGPWLLEWLAHRLLRRGLRTVDWADLRLR